MVARELRYVTLVVNLGGDIDRWKRMPERKLQFYDKVVECIIRKRRMKEEEEKARSKGGYQIW